MAAVRSDKRNGRVNTPSAVADALCSWAIRGQRDVVLDLGVGEGAFALAAVKRLRELGAPAAAASALIHGAESDPQAFAHAQESASKTLGVELPNVVCADFHTVVLPEADVVVGNPPYIRRQLQSHLARSRASLGLLGIDGLADAYCYFLLRACRALRPGGRLAVIVSASWLDMRYGLELRRLLLEEFDLQLLLGFDGQLFPDALVKPVVLLAERTGRRNRISFARLADSAPLEGLKVLLSDVISGRENKDATVTQVAPSDLSPTMGWSGFLKSPATYKELIERTGLVPLGSVAETRIGLQTFAKSFFVLEESDILKWGIEPQYLARLVFSPRYTPSAVIRDSHSLRHFLFFCDRSLSELAGTGAAAYVTSAMEARVRVRGKDEWVDGFHRAPRLARAHRTPWYNLKSEIERRGSFPILLPRRVFKSYVVVHNVARAIPNEDFIEVRPTAGSTVEAPLLCFLNSSIGEFVVRSNGFQYGGGVFNLNPGAVRHIPVMDPSNLSSAARARLDVAWQRYAAGYGNPEARRQVDQTVAEVLGMAVDLRQQVDLSLAVLTRLSTVAGKAYGGSVPTNVSLW